MKIAGTSQIPFPPAKAYEMMRDPQVLAKAIPGCEGLEKTGADEYKLKMKMVLASLSGAFEGKVRLSDPQPPASFRMLVEGSSRIGFMRGEGLLKLTDKDGGTEVSYEGDVQVGGTMAAIGQRLIDVTARMLMRRFFENLAGSV
ncbi:MAG TPA: carbon monoxide dehydrogenase subunit G [Bryobacteraceae bacterium]|nr:carbon monoxide dehydrogenase subunit G [Bryobacteraceae bacterium]